MHHSTPGVRVIKKKDELVGGQDQRLVDVGELVVREVKVREGRVE